MHIQLRRDVPPHKTLLFWVGVRFSEAPRGWVAQLAEQWTENSMQHA
jgi:hypothetical protein